MRVYKRGWWYGVLERMTGYGGLHAGMAIAVLAVVANWGFTKAPIFQSAYNAQLNRQNDNAWLHVQCQTPDFYSHMRQHTSVCELVRQAYALSPTMAGLQACFPSGVSNWNRMFIGILLGMFVVLAPALLLPAWQLRVQRMQIGQLHRAMKQYSIRDDGKQAV